MSDKKVHRQNFKGKEYLAIFFFNDATQEPECRFIQNYDNKLKLV